MQKPINIIFLLFLSLSSFASHNRAGELSHKWISGYTYEISVTTFAKGYSVPADRCSIVIDFGNGDTAIVCRSNFEPGDPPTDFWGASCSGNPICTSPHMGEWSMFPGANLKKNIYKAIHTYPGPGTYTITMSDPNFEDGIVNVPDGSPMTMVSTLTIFGSPGLRPYNNSVTYQQIPYDTAELSQQFVYNPNAIDPDGDSLSYSLIPPIGISGYVYPTATNSFSINPATGDVVWDAPNFIGTYIFCVVTHEWTKNAANSNYYQTGNSMQLVYVLVEPASSVNELNGSMIRLKVYPNPACDRVGFFFLDEKNAFRGKLEIYDHTGKKIQVLEMYEREIIANTETLPKGMYFYRFLAENYNSAMGKFEVAR